MKKKAVYPTKTSMNLFYKPDRTTKPSTVALYALFVLVCLLGLAKWLVYDLWMERAAAEQALATAQEELNNTMVQLADYNEVQERYFRYSATDEERARVDRMEVLAMVENAVGRAQMDSISFNGEQAQIQVSNVTLAQIAEIVSRLEASPLVGGTQVNTAATSGSDEGNSDLVQAIVVIQLQKEAEGK